MRHRHSFAGIAIGASDGSWFRGSVKAGTPGWGIAVVDAAVGRHRRQLARCGSASLRRRARPCGQTHRVTLGHREVDSAVPVAHGTHLPNADRAPGWCSRRRGAARPLKGSCMRRCGNGVVTSLLAISGPLRGHIEGRGRSEVVRRDGAASLVLVQPVPGVLHDRGAMARRGRASQIQHQPCLLGPAPLQAGGFCRLVTGHPASCQPPRR
jgi:hypothetical protein